MEKQIEFLKNKIENGDYPKLVKQIDFNKTITFNPISMIKTIKPEISERIKDNSVTFYNKRPNESHALSKKVILRYDKEADFEYFVTNASKHTGEFKYVQNEIKVILDQLAKGLKFDRNQDIAKFNPYSFWIYDIEYTIGDFIIGSEKIRIANKDKVVDGQVDVVLLPVNVKYIRNKNK